MYRYVKVKKEIAEKMGLAHLRNSLPDGDYILNQSDLLPCEGNTIEEKAASIGAVLLNENEALNLLNQ